MADEFEGGTMAALMAADEKKKKSVNQDTKIPRYRDTLTDSKVGTNDEHYAETVRRAVRQLGSESATLRLTDLEKDALFDIIYAYKKKGVRTSETQIIRIALNYILNDYDQNADTSIVAEVIERLNA